MKKAALAYAVTASTFALLISLYLLAQYNKQRVNSEKEIQFSIESNEI